jgi:hypothetical protein
MPDPVFIHRYKMTIYGHDGLGNFFENVTYWWVQPDPDQDVAHNLEKFLDAVNAQVGVAYTGVMGADAYIDGYKASKIDPDPTSPSVLKTVRLPGTREEPVDVGAIAINYQFFPLTKSARHMGHLYAGGLGDTVFQDGILADDAAAGNLRDAFVDHLTWNTGAGEAKLIIRSADGTYDEIADVTYSGLPAVLPRRIKPFG